MKKMIILGVVAMFSTLGFVTKANPESSGTQEYGYAEVEILTCDDGCQFTAVVMGNTQEEVNEVRETWLEICC